MSAHHALRGTPRGSSSQENRECIRHLLYSGMMGRGEPRRDVRIHVELTENSRAALDQNNELGPGIGIAGEVIIDRGNIRNHLVLACGDCCSTHTGAYRDSHMLRRSPGIRFQYQVLSLQHVRVDGCEGGAPGAEALASKLEHLLTRRIVQVSRPEGPHERARVRHCVQEPPRFPNTALS